MTVLGLVLAAPAVVAAKSAPTRGTPSDSPFAGSAQWIWYVSKSGGNAVAIAKKAKKYGIGAVFVKSGDGATYWNQFDQIVGPLKEQGIKVCAWQFVYGRSPSSEARIAIRAIQAGADCFIVDAESTYEGGHYKAARAYMKKIRLAIGPHYPIGLSSFPYVDYHPSFPYSAFFEPPYGAQFNVPQVYWRAIGTSTTKAMNHTYFWNNLYTMPIAPAAGTWLGETKKEIRNFRRLATLNGSPGVSYWDWQETKSWQWPAFSSPLDPSLSDSILPLQYPKLGQGSRGDPVVWVQVQLNEWGYFVKRTGYFKQQTLAAVQDFQAARGLPVTGKLDTATWTELLKPPTEAAGKRGSGGVGGRAAAASDSGFTSEPRSAKLPALGYEIPRHKK